MNRGRIYYRGDDALRFGSVCLWDRFRYWLVRLICDGRYTVHCKHANRGCGSYDDQKDPEVA